MEKLRKYLLQDGGANKVLLSEVGQLQLNQESKNEQKNNING